MRKGYVILMVLLVLVACNSATKPSKANFAKAINQYLATHGDVCTVIGNRFPIDIPRSGENLRSYTATRMAALEQAGLVRSTDTTAVVRDIPNPFARPAPQAVKRYDLTEEGRKYFRLIPSADGQTGGFCYGQKSVDSIIKWTEPETTGAYSQTEVTYTYKIANPASWAKAPGVQQVFSDIQTTFTGASRTPQIAGLRLTNKGWEVPGQ